MVQEDLVVVVGGGIIFLGRDVVFWLFCVFVQACPAMGVNCSTVGVLFARLRCWCGDEGITCSINDGIQHPNLWAGLKNRFLVSFSSLKIYFLF